MRVYVHSLLILSLWRTQTNTNTKSFEINSDFISPFSLYVKISVAYSNKIYIYFFFLMIQLTSGGLTQAPES